MKSKIHPSSLALLGLTALLPITQTAKAQSVSWDVEKAIALGSGCNSQASSDRPIDTFFEANGNELIVKVATLRVTLPSNGELLSDRQNCSLRVPLQVESGFYISAIEQKISFGVAKSSSSLGSISARSTIFNAPVAPLTELFTQGKVMYEPKKTVTRKDEFNGEEFVALIRNWCRAPQGIYKHDISLSAQKEDENEFIRLRVDGNIDVNVTADLKACPDEEDVTTFDSIRF